MRDLDETDLEILELLVSDARRPYSDIAEAVGLSPPAVSDRVARLRELGVVRRFTVDVDRSQLAGGTPVLITLDVPSEAGEPAATREELLATGSIEHVFTTAEGDLVVSARLPDTDVAGWLGRTLGTERIGDFDVTLLSGVDWSPGLDGTAFALACAECGNTVDSEGTATRIDGDVYRFCCPSCAARFEERYEELRGGAE